MSEKAINQAEERQSDNLTSMRVSDDIETTKKELLVPKARRSSFLVKSSAGPCVGILTVVGGVLLQLLLGSCYAWGGLNLFVISYLIRFEPNLTPLDGFFIMPVAIFSSALFFYYGARLEAKYGARKVLVVGVFFNCAGYLIIWAAKSLLVLNLGIFISGIGVGISYLPPLRTCWKYFPKNRGLISGLILAGFGSSGLLFNAVGSVFINPNGKKPELLINGNRFYDKDIADKVPAFILFLVVVFFVIGMTGSLMTSPFISNLDTLTEEEMTEHELKKIREQEEKKKLEKFSIAFCSRDYLLCGFLGFFTLFYPFMITNTSKTFGSINDLDEKLLVGMVTTYALINGLSRVVIGMLKDLFTFRFLYCMLNLFIILISSTIFFVVDYDYIYFAYNMISATCLGAHFALFPTFVSEKFGINNSTELYGILFITYGLTSVLGAMITKFIIKETTDYLICFLIGSGTSLLSFMICFSMNHEPFVYKRIEEDNYEREKELQGGSL